MQWLHVWWWFAVQVCIAAGCVIMSVLLERQRRRFARFMEGFRMHSTVWSGTFRLLGIDVKCHVLDNGQRVVEADSMMALMKAIQDGNEFGDPQQLVEFSRWRAGFPADL